MFEIGNLKVLSFIFLFKIALVTLIYDNEVILHFKSITELEFHWIYRTFWGKLHFKHLKKSSE